MNTDTLEATSLIAIPLLTYKMAKTEAPQRLWILGESYQNTGNLGTKTNPPRFAISN